MATKTQHNYVVLSQSATNWTGQVTRSVLTVDAYKQKTGVPVPGWKRKIESLQNASSPYTKVERSIKAPAYAGSATLIRKRAPIYEGTVSWDGTWFAPKSAQPIPTHDTSVIKYGTGKFYSKASDALSPFKGLIFLAELEDSLQLVGTNALRVAKAYRLRHRRVSTLLRAYRRYIRWRPGSRGVASRRVLADISNLWLEWSFGISPLLSDIESAAEAYYGPRVEVRTVKTRAKADKKVIYQSIGSANLPTYAAFYDTRTVLTSETDVRYRGALKCEIPSRVNPLAGSAERYGLTFRQFVPTLWEATPWSFLVDYFLNVGQTLNAYAYHDADWIYAVKTAKTTRVASYVTRWWPGSGDPNWAVKSCSTGSWSGEQTTSRLDRSTLSIADAGLRVSYPPLGAKWANMLALAVSRLRK